MYVIISLRWVSDDPEYYVEPIDLFDEQKKGLPDYYGKKDKQTTEQAWFTCNVCECDLKSVVTLRAHCKGSQHVRKALQKKKEFKAKEKLKIEKDAGPSTSPHPARHQCKTLFDWLEMTSEAVVGLEFITEYFREGSRDDPRYNCELCDDTQGDAEYMKNHILSLKHKQSFLERKTGSFLVHQSEIQQHVAEFTKDYVRDYRDMKEVTDDRLWADVNRGRLRTRRERSRSPRRVKHEGDDHRHRDRRDRSRSRTKRERQDYYHHDDRESDYRNRRGDDDRRRRRDYHGQRAQEDVRNGDSYVKTERRYDDDVEEVSRSGDFANWKTAPIKTSREEESTSHNSVPSHSQDAPSVEVGQKSSIEEDIKRLHVRVAKVVMKNLNKYYEESEEFEGNIKIRNADDYSRVAKQLSHELRGRIKESYEEFHGTLEGVSLTPDNVAFIEGEVERFFWDKPSIRR